MSLQSNLQTKNSPQVECLVAFGGNMGDVADSYQQLQERLQEQDCNLKLKKASRLFRTAPVGENAGADFLNAALLLETSLSPMETLHVLNQFELELGRQRILHWGPRTVDLDLILHGQTIMNEARLTIPHPACWYRRFVLDPILDIAPDAIHPLKKVSFSILQKHLSSRPLVIGFAGGTQQDRDFFIKETAQNNSVQTFDWHQNNPMENHQNASLILWLGQPNSNSAIHLESLPLLSRLDLLQGCPAESLTRDTLQKRIESIFQSVLDTPLPSP